MRAICEGSFDLPLSVDAALPLFTPEGERRWAGPSWDPVYVVPGPDDGATGTVFTTESDGGAAVWIVLERRRDAIAYARVAPGRIAGTVGVALTPGASEDECTATVTYDVTSLSDEGAAFVEKLEAGYEAFLAHWRDAILGCLREDGA